MRRCLKCGKDVKKVIVMGELTVGQVPLAEQIVTDAYYVHKTKHTCSEKLTRHEVESYKIPQQRFCKLCWKKVQRGEQTGKFTWVHTEPHSCKEVLRNHEATVPLKLIVTPSGVWNDVQLVKLPTPKLARTMVLKVQAPVYGGEFKVHVCPHISGTKVFVVRAYGQIPKTCHYTLGSAISNIKYRIWRYNSKSGNWKYLREPVPVNPGVFKI